MLSVKKARKFVEDQSLLFKRSLDRGDYNDALKQAASMLNSLADITDPQQYAEIESQCVSEISYLAKWIKINKIESFYETVQYIPGGYSRLYLMWAVSGDDLVYQEDFEHMLCGLQQPLHAFHLQLRMGAHSLRKFGWLNLMWVRIRFHPPYKDIHREIRINLQPHIQHVLHTLVQSPDSVLPLLKHAISSKDALSQSTIALALARLSPALAQHCQAFLAAVSQFTADITPILHAFFQTLEEHLYHSNDSRVFADCLAGTLDLLKCTCDCTQTLKICIGFTSIFRNHATDDNLIDILRLVDERTGDASAADCQLLLELLLTMVNLSPNLPSLIDSDCFMHLSALLLADRLTLLCHIAKCPAPQENLMVIFSYLTSDIESYTSEYVHALSALIHSLSPTMDGYVGTLDCIYAEIKDKCPALVPVVVHKWILQCYSNECTGHVLGNILGALDVLQVAEYHFTRANLALQALMCLDRSAGLVDDADMSDKLVDHVLKSLTCVGTDSRLHLFLSTVATLTYISRIPIQAFITTMTSSAVELFDCQQSAAIIACCRLYLEPSQHRKALSCVKKALKTAGQCDDVIEECRLILDVVNHIAYLRGAGILEVDEVIVEESMGRVECRLENISGEGLQRYQINLNNIISQWNK